MIKDDTTEITKANSTNRPMEKAENKLNEMTHWSNV